VIEINESLEDEPELINSSCYDDGWLIKFKSESVDSLMDSSAYEETLESE
jgi:glycine cleavage system H protein